MPLKFCFVQNYAKYPIMRQKNHSWSGFGFLRWHHRCHCYHFSPLTSRYNFLMVITEEGNSYSYQESSRSQLPILSFFLSSCHHCMIHQFCSLVLQTRTATEQFKSEMRHIYSVSTVYLQCISSADREAGWMEFCVVTSSYVTPCSLSHPACAWLTARWWNCSRSKVTHCNSIFIVVMLSRLSDQYQLLWCIEIWHILLLSGKLWPQHFPRLSRFSRASGNLLVVGDV